MSMLGNCPNLVRDSLYVRFAAVFNHERCSLSGSTVYPGHVLASVRSTFIQRLILLLKVSAAAVVEGGQALIA